ncbi:hypothetical protein BE04_17180 [Sorangium cellulosum]|uniref:Uncharacterized protein n=3 Tax=Sorangium cellulosum TaxID=56 RepID=A0A150P508_SORCE|nr:hypothetical protein SCE1572_38695 [Sorangium cellulosum So0157-2]KYF50750.1 hypothetical protein BE04_17180 [Sorangium cellulosum]KYG10696.1 hypothetical protein BE21_10490 [Sorangium cellulosum]
MVVSPCTDGEAGAMTRERWVEVWIESSSRGGYLLVLRPGDAGGFELRDPQKGGEAVERFATYEDAVHWLNEDEYDLVEGRWYHERAAAGGGGG